MTNIPTLREVLSRVESLKGPLTRGEAEKIADKLFMLSQDRVEWLDVVAALGGGRSALGAVVALVERNGEEWDVGSLAIGHVYTAKDDFAGQAEAPALALLAAYLRARIAEGEQP